MPFYVDSKADDQFTQAIDTLYGTEQEPQDKASQLAKRREQKLLDLKNKTTPSWVVDNGHNLGENGQKYFTDGDFSYSTKNKIETTLDDKQYQYLLGKTAADYGVTPVRNTKTGEVERFIDTKGNERSPQELADAGYRYLYMYADKVDPNHAKIGTAAFIKDRWKEGSDARYTPVEGGYGYESGPIGVDVNKRKMELLLPGGLADALETIGHGRKRVLDHRLYKYPVHGDKSEYLNASKNFGSGVTEDYDSAQGFFGDSRTDTKVTDKLYKEFLSLAGYDPDQSNASTNNTQLSFKDISKGLEERDAKIEAENMGLFGRLGNAVDALQSSVAKEAALDTADWIGEVTGLWDLGTEEEKTALADKWAGYNKYASAPAMEEASKLGKELADELGDDNKDVDWGKVAKLAWLGVTNPEITGTSLGYIGSTFIPFLGWAGKAAKVGKLADASVKVPLRAYTKEVKQAVKAGKITPKEATQLVKQAKQEIGSAKRVVVALQKNAGLLNISAGNVNDQIDAYKEEHGELPSTAKVVSMYATEVAMNALDRFTDVNILTKAKGGINALKSLVKHDIDPVDRKSLIGTATLGVAKLIDSGLTEAAQEYAQTMGQVLNVKWDFDQKGNPTPIDILTNKDVVAGGITSAGVAAGVGAQMHGIGLGMHAASKPVDNAVGAVQDRFNNTNVPNVNQNEDSSAGSGEPKTTKELKDEYLATLNNVVSVISNNSVTAESLPTIIDSLEKLHINRHALVGVPKEKLAIADKVYNDTVEHLTDIITKNPTIKLNKEALRPLEDPEQAAKQTSEVLGSSNYSEADRAADAERLIRLALTTKQEKSPEETISALGTFAKTNGVSEERFNSLVKSYDEVEHEATKGQDGYLSREARILNELRKETPDTKKLAYEYSKLTGMHESTARSIKALDAGIKEAEALAANNNAAGTIGKSKYVTTDYKKLDPTTGKAEIAYDITVGAPNKNSDRWVAHTHDANKLIAVKQRTLAGIEEVLKRVNSSIKDHIPEVAKDLNTAPTSNKTTTSKGAKTTLDKIDASMRWLEEKTNKGQSSIKASTKGADSIKNLLVGVNKAFKKELEGNELSIDHLRGLLAHAKILQESPVVSVATIDKAIEKIKGVKHTDTHLVNTDNAAIISIVNELPIHDFLKDSIINQLQASKPVPIKPTLEAILDARTGDTVDVTLLLNNLAHVAKSSGNEALANVLSVHRNVHYQSQEPKPTSTNNGTRNVSSEPKQTNIADTGVFNDLAKADEPTQKEIANVDDFMKASQEPTQKEIANVDDFMKASQEPTQKEIANVDDFMRGFTENTQKPAQKETANTEDFMKASQEPANKPAQKQEADSSVFNALGNANTSNHSSAQKKSLTKDAKNTTSKFTPEELQNSLKSKLENIKTQGVTLEALKAAQGIATTISEDLYQTLKQLSELDYGSEIDAKGDFTPGVATKTSIAFDKVFYALQDSLEDLQPYTSVLLALENMYRSNQKNKKAVFEEAYRTIIDGNVPESVISSQVAEVMTELSSTENLDEYLDAYNTVVNDIQSIPDFFTTWVDISGGSYEQLLDGKSHLKILKKHYNTLTKSVPEFKEFGAPVSTAMFKAELQVIADNLGTNEAKAIVSSIKNINDIAGAFNEFGRLLDNNTKQSTNKQQKEQVTESLEKTSTTNKTETANGTKEHLSKKDELLERIKTIAKAIETENTADNRKAAIGIFNYLDSFPGYIKPKYRVPGDLIEGLRYSYKFVNNNDSLFEEVETARTTEEVFTEEATTKAIKDISNVPSPGSLMRSHLNKEAELHALGLQAPMVYEELTTKNGSIKVKKAAFRPESNFFRKVPLDPSAYIKVGENTYLNTVPATHEAIKKEKAFTDRFNAFKTYLEKTIESLSKEEKEVGEGKTPKRVYNLYNSPARAILFNNDGTLNDQVVAALMVSGYENLIFKKADLVKKFKDRGTVARLFNVADMQVTPAMSRLASAHGALATTLANDIGKGAAKLLGLREAENAPNGLYQSLLADLGNMGLLTFEKAGYLQSSRVTIAAIKDAAGEHANTSHLTASDEATVKFVNLKSKAVHTNNGYTKYDIVDNVNKGLDSAKEELLPMFPTKATERVEPFIGKKVPKKVKEKKLRRMHKDSLGRVIPEKSQKAMEILMDTSYKVSKKELGQLVKDLKEYNPLVLSSLGYVDLKSEEFAQMSYEEKQVQEAKNANALKSIEELELLHKKLEDEDIEETDMYFAYNFVANGRFNLDSNTINPQTNKVHRFAIVPKKAYLEYEVQNTDDGLLFHTMDKGEKVDISFGVRMALAQAFGIGIDKVSNNEIIKVGNALLSLDDEQIDALKHTLLTKGEVYLLADNEEVRLKVDHISHTLQGINFLKAVTSRDGGNFTAPLVLETDSMTSGFANKTQQYPVLSSIELEESLSLEDANKKTMDEHFSRVAVLTKSMKEKLNAEETIFDPEQGLGFNDLIAKGNEIGYNDSYKNLGIKSISTVKDPSYIEEQLSSKGAKLFNSIKTLLPGGDNFSSLEVVITSELRNLFKNPFMIFNYSAGINRIVKNLSANTAEDVISKLAKADLNNLSDAEAKTFDALLNLGITIRWDDESTDTLLRNTSRARETLQRALRTVPTYRISIRPIRVKNKDLEGKQPKPPKNIEELIAQITEFTYGTAVGNVFREEFRAFTEIQDVTNDVFKVMFRYFIKKRDEALVAVLKENKTITKEDIKKVNTDLHKIFPYVTGPLSNKGKLDMIAIVKNEVTSTTDLLSGREAPQTRISKTDEKGAATSKARAQTVELKEPTSSGAVLPFHFIDGAEMAEMLTAFVNYLNDGSNDAGMTTVHDAKVVAPNILDMASWQYNKAMYDTNKNYSILEHITKHYNEVVNLMEKEPEEKLRSINIKELKINPKVKGKYVYNSFSEVANALRRQVQALNDKVQKIRSRYYKKDGTGILDTASFGNMVSTPGSIYTPGEKGPSDKYKKAFKQRYKFVNVSIKSTTKPELETTAREAYGTISNQTTNDTDLNAITDKIKDCV